MNIINYLYCTMVSYIGKLIHINKSDVKNDVKNDVKSNSKSDENKREWRCNFGMISNIIYKYTSFFYTYTSFFYTYTSSFYTYTSFFYKRLFYIIIGIIIGLYIKYGHFVVSIKYIKYTNGQLIGDMVKDGKIQDLKGIDTVPYVSRVYRQIFDPLDKVAALSYTEYMLYNKKWNYENSTFKINYNYNYNKHGDVISDDLYKEFDLFMQYSVVSYCPSVYDKKWSCGFRCEGNVEGFKVEDAFKTSLYGIAGYVGYDKNKSLIVVVFRGTADIQTVITEIMFLLNNPDDVRFMLNNLNISGDAMINRGYLESYYMVKDRLQNVLGRLVKLYPEYKITFTGHSLGGALASIAMVDFMDKNIDVLKDRISLYTYGQPRVGNLGWVDFVNNLGVKIYRVIKSGDIIQYLPPSWLGYRHFDDQYNIARHSHKTTKCINKESCDSDIVLLNVVPHITGYYGWWTYPWFC